MLSFWKPAIASLLTVCFVAVLGCQRGGDADSATAASVNGPGSENSGRADGSKSDQDPLHPVLTVETTLGNFTVRLDREKAPITVDNFLSYAESHFYDQTIFHQVLKEYPKIVLGGAYTPDLVEKKARVPIRNEARNCEKNRRGTIAMARRQDDADSATCNFFINLADNEVLDHKDQTPQGYGFCVFGDVIEGMETVERIGQVSTRDVDKFERLPAETVAIKSIHRLK